MKKLLICLLIIATLFSAVSCGSKSIIGKWMFGVNSFEFREDNTVSVSISGMLNYDGTYTVEDDKIIITAVGLLGMETVEEFTYSLDGDSLTLTGDITFAGGADTTLTFEKQK